MSDDKSPLYVPHARALALSHSEVDMVASQLDEVFPGTAGSVIERTNADGFRYYAHKFYDGDGKPRERYLAGPTGSEEADSAAASLRDRIQEVKDLVPTLRMLGREGFNLVDRKTFATLAVLHNHGVFRAGGMLIGSHAFGILMNKLGARSTPYATEDIDIARAGALAFKTVPKKKLLEMLRESGIEFVEVPSLDRKKPATSFKQRGRARFQVDLLVPSRDETFPVVPVPELGANAKGLPYLQYLLADSQPGTLLAREGACAVCIPLPERFAVHKLIVSQLRSGRSEKSAKDVHQACVLAAVLADMFPGAIETAVASIPRRALKHLRKAIGSARPILEAKAPRAWGELSGTES